MSRVRCPTTKVLSPTNTAKAIWDLMQLMEPEHGRLPTFLENGWKEMMTTGYIKRRELWMVAVSCFRLSLPQAVHGQSSISAGTILFLRMM